MKHEEQFLLFRAILNEKPFCSVTMSSFYRRITLSLYRLFRAFISSAKKLELELELYVHTENHLWTSYVYYPALLYPIPDPNSVSGLPWKKNTGDLVSGRINHSIRGCKGQISSGRVADPYPGFLVGPVLDTNLCLSVYFEINSTWEATYKT